MKISQAMVADTAFIKTFGGINFEEFHDIIQLPDSGFMMTGVTNGYGSGSNAIYIVRADKNGNHVWSKALGGSGAEIGNSIAGNSTGLYYIAGTTSSYGNGGYDGYLICIDSAGTVQWEKTFGGSDWDFLNAVKVMPDQSILLAGESYSFSDGGSDAWVLHLNSSGDTTWTRHYGSNGNDAFKGIELSSTAIYLAGYVDSTDSNGQDGFLVKLDLQGNFISQQRYNNLGRDQLNGCFMNASGNIIIYGSTTPFDSTNNGFWVQEIDTIGNSIWVQNGVGTENQYFNKVLAIRNNELVCIGQKNPSGFGRSSMFTMKLTAGGSYLDSHSFGGGNEEEGFSGVRTMEGGIAFVGYTTSYGVANKDAMLVRLRYDSTVTPNLFYSTTLYIENLSPIAVFEIKINSELNISPNPATAFITIESKSGIKIDEVFLYSPSGKLIDTEQKSFIGKSRLELSRLQEAGVYFLKVRTGREWHSGKVIIVQE